MKNSCWLIVLFPFLLKGQINGADQFRSDLTAYVGLISLDGLHDFKFTYHKKRRYRLALMKGAEKGFTLGSTLFFWNQHTFNKPYETIAPNNEKYFTYNQEHHSVGIRIGASKYRNHNLLAENEWILDANALFMGLSVFQESRTIVIEKESFRSSSVRASLHAEVVRYFDGSFLYVEDIVSDHSELLNEYGYRLYLEGALHIGNARGRLALYYMVGVAKGIMKDAFYFPLGFGIGLSFA